MTRQHQVTHPHDQHDAAVMRAEVRRLVIALAPYRVLHRDALKDVCGAGRWHDGGFELALAAALETGAIERLPGDFYREPRQQTAT